MDLSKFTERARGFIQAAQTIAIRENHQRILPEHILKALLDDDQGFASNLIARSGVMQNRFVIMLQPRFPNCPRSKAAPKPISTIKPSK